VLALVVTASASGCGGCAGSSGVILDARPSPSFVTERAFFYGIGAKGIERASIDGTERKLVFASPPEGGLHVIDTTADQRMFLIGNSNTDLLVGDVATGVMRPVDVVKNRMSTASFSPDGKRFAVARHSDYSVPQGTSKEDDTIWIVDTATLAATEIPKSSESWPARIDWAEDQSGLHVRMNWEGTPQWISLPDMVRHPGVANPPAKMVLPPRNPRPTCPVTPVTARWGTTIRLVATSALDGGSPHRETAQDLEKMQGTTVVTLEGRKRGFHDYMDDFYEVTMTPACNYVLFQHEGGVWIADAKGGATAITYPGGFLFFERP